MAVVFDPFRDVDRLAEMMLGSAANPGQADRAMPIDLFKSGDEYVLQCDLPGVDPGSVDVDVDGRMLTIRAHRSPREEGTQWLTQERATGTFARQLSLGTGLDLDRIRASYADGVLTLWLPVAEQAKPRRISVEHATSSISSSAEDTSG